MRTHTSKPGKHVAVSEAPSRPYLAANYLRTNEDRAAYLEALLEDGDARVLTLGLRDLAESVGGMSALASKAGLSRETLYRTLSDVGNPRLDTLAAILKVFGLRLSVQSADREAA